MRHPNLASGFPVHYCIYPRRRSERASRAFAGANWSMSTPTTDIPIYACLLATTHASPFRCVLGWLGSLQESTIVL